MPDYDLQLMPEQQPRVETGPMQFGSDWPGVFFRGDNALFFARAVDQAAERLSDDPILAGQLRGLASDLYSCSVGDTGWPPGAHSEKVEKDQHICLDIAKRLRELADKLEAATKP